VSLIKRLFRIETARKLVQLFCFLILNAVIFGWAPTPISLPILNGLGSPQKTVGDAFATLQLMLYDAVFPWLPIASFLLIAIVFGRATCGWICPFGFIQDLLGYVKRKHSEVSARTYKDMVKVKYGILAVTLFISIVSALTLALGVGQGFKGTFGVFAQAPFEALSPANTLFAKLPSIALTARYTIPLWLQTGDVVGNMLNGIVSMPTIFWVQFAIMVAIIVLGVYYRRSWCQYFCPHGAALALLNKFSFLGLKREPVKCTKAQCRDCVEVCPMKVPILDLPWEKFTHPECIYCLKCVDACTTKAIKPKFP
jgi:ferredoxin-type protein NapH